MTKKVTAMNLRQNLGEFLNEIQSVAKKAKFSLMKISLIELNSMCSREAGIPSLHPYWSLVQIKNNKIWKHIQ